MSEPMRKAGKYVLKSHAGDISAQAQCTFNDTSKPWRNVDGLTGPYVIFPGAWMINPTTGGTWPLTDEIFQRDMEPVPDGT